MFGWLRSRKALENLTYSCFSFFFHMKNKRYQIQGKKEGKIIRNKFFSNQLKFSHSGSLYSLFVYFENLTFDSQAVTKKPRDTYFQVNCILQYPTPVKPTSWIIFEISNSITYLHCLHDSQVTLETINNFSFFNWEWPWKFCIFFLNYFFYYFFRIHEK